MPQDGFTQRVVPLFETLADLRSAGASLRRLLSVPWYRRLLQCVSYTSSKHAEGSLKRGHCLDIHSTKREQYRHTC